MIRGYGTKSAVCRSPLAVALAALLVVSWLAGVKPPVREPPCTGDCMPNDERDARAAEQRFESMRRMVQQEAQGVPNQVLASGDTCGMRYKGLYGRVDPQLDLRFTMAVVVQDPDRRLHLLEDLLARGGELSPIVQLRLDVERVRTLLRAGRIADAEALLAGMPRRPAEGIPSPCVSDVNFYAGMVASLRGHHGEALTAFARAVSQDPFSFQARVAYLEALYLRQLHEFRSNSECAAAVADFVEGLHRLRPLLEDPRQLLDFADSLARAGSPRTKPTRLAIAYAYLWSGRSELASRHASEGLALASALPRVCSRLLDEEFGRIVSQVGGEDDERAQDG